MWSVSQPLLRKFAAAAAAAAVPDRHYISRGSSQRAARPGEPPSHTAPPLAYVGFPLLTVFLPIGLKSRKRLSPNRRAFAALAPLAASRSRSATN